MRVAVRPSQGRTLFILAFLALAAPSTVLGAGGSAAPPIPEPRAMEPGGVSGYRLPFEAGTEVRIEQGWFTGYSHNGRSGYAYDFGLYIGTPVLAAATGVVTYTHSGETRCGGPELRLRANLVTIDHPDGSATQYGHLATVGVEVGDVVEAGQVIGTSGNTGYTGCLPHLHFARQVQGGVVTRSIPVYFKGYENRQFVSDELVAAKPTCLSALATATEADAATNTFCGSYFAGDFEGPALFARSDGLLQVDREDGGPGGYWLNGAATYSARWAGTFYFAPWSYRFQIEATGGIRVLLDGQVLYEDWSGEAGLRTVDVTRRLRAGVGQIEVEHLSTQPRDVVKIEWSPLRLDH